ncbi:MAG: addiction module protein [Halioglobus sp.]
MSDAVKILIDQALELPASERAVMAEQLLLSLDQPNPKLIQSGHLRLELRLMAYQIGEAEAVPR